jgi:hypothetical protein
VGLWAVGVWCGVWVCVCLFWLFGLWFRFLLLKLDSDVTSKPKDPGWSHTGGTSTSIKICLRNENRKIHQQSCFLYKNNRKSCFNRSMSMENASASATRVGPSRILGFACNVGVQLKKQKAKPQPKQPKQTHTHPNTTPNTHSPQTHKPTRKHTPNPHTTHNTNPQAHPHRCNLS